MYQKVLVIGNLGNEPQLRYTAEGDAVTSFSLATNRRWTTPEGEEGEETVWFRVSAWGKLAENCNQYLAKGRQIFVEGRLVPDRKTGGPRLWTGEDGLVRANYELRAITVQFLGGSPGAQTESAVDEAVSEAEEIDF